MMNSEDFQKFTESGIQGLLTYQPENQKKYRLDPVDTSYVTPDQDVFGSLYIPRRREKEVAKQQTEEQVGDVENTPTQYSESSSQQTSSQQGPLPPGRQERLSTPKYERDDWTKKLATAYRNAGITNEDMIRNLVRQDILEAGWEQKQQGRFNYGNITVGSSWKGSWVQGRDHLNGERVPARFRNYNSIDEYIRDKLNTLRVNFNFNQDDDFETFLSKLVDGRMKYATSSEYKNSMRRMARTDVAINRAGGIIRKMQDGDKYVWGSESTPIYHPFKEKVYSSQKTPVELENEYEADKEDRRDRFRRERYTILDNQDKIIDKVSKHYIPYIKDKEIMLTKDKYNTGKISTNLLDSLYDSAKRTNTHISTVLGLAGVESTLGIGREYGIKKHDETNKGIDILDLMSNWQYINDATPTVYGKEKEMYRRLDNPPEEDIETIRNYVKRSTENTERNLNQHPLDYAINYFKTGKYNPGEKGHTEKVLRHGQILMSDPAIKKWLKEKENN